MDAKRNFSSYFVSPAGIGILFSGALTSNYFGQPALTGFLLFGCLLFTLSWLWGRLAMRHVEIRIEAENHRNFSGTAFPVSFRVSNEKMLPLIWLEIFLRFPEKSCVMPADGFDTALCRDGEEEPPYWLGKRKFTWVMWHQTISWETEFSAQRRGIYFFDQATVASGDGFGLMVKETVYPLANPSVFVVYPKPVPVDTTVFLQNMHNASAGSRGYYEDVTLLRSSRDYQQTDSLKKINWRLLARKDEMQVNVYEKILPRSCFFVLDLLSFQKREMAEGKEEPVLSTCEEELEDLLSVTGSLLLRLAEQKMHCGLAVPRTGRNREQFLMPSDEETQLHEMLTALAGVAYRGESIPVNEEKILAEREQLGQIYILCRSWDSCSCKMVLERMNPVKVTLLTQASQDDHKKLENRILPVSALKGGSRP